MKFPIKGSNNPFRIDNTSIGEGQPLFSVNPLDLESGNGLEYNSCSVQCVVIAKRPILIRSQSQAITKLLVKMAKGYIYFIIGIANVSVSNSCSIETIRITLNARKITFHPHSCLKPSLGVKHVHVRID